VITPVRGSAFNPFNIISLIKSVDGGVTRELSMMPTISQNDDGNFKSALEEKFLFFETGNFKVGLKEPLDSNAITYRFNKSAPYLTETFYNKNSKTYSTAPSGIGSLSSYGLSNMIKNSLDYIIDTYKVSDVTFFDVFRRLSINKFSQVSYEADQELFNEILTSFRNNVKISNTFIENSNNSMIEVSYGGSRYKMIEDYDLLPDDEKVIITSKRRKEILKNPILME